MPLAGAGTIPPMYHHLFYDYVPDMLERRGPMRLAHLAHARRVVAEGELKLALFMSVLSFCAVAPKST